MYCIMIDCNQLQERFIDYFKGKIHEVYFINDSCVSVVGKEDYKFFKGRFILFDTLKKAENYIYLT